MMICNKKTFYISKYNKIQAEGKNELTFGDFCYVAGLKTGI